MMKFQANRLTKKEKKKRSLKNRFIEAKLMKKEHRKVEIKKLVQQKLIQKKFKEITVAESFKDDIDKRFSKEQDDRANLEAMKDKFNTSKFRKN